MKQLLIIPHRLPSMNEFAGKKTRWTYGTLKKNVQASIDAEILRQRLKPMPYAYLSFVWFEPNKRRNPDNCVSAQKFVLDALVARKILKNDGWSEVLGLRHQFVCQDDGLAAVHVTLSDDL
jgi:hypothetical protein